MATLADRRLCWPKKETDALDATDPDGRIAPGSAVPAVAGAGGLSRRVVLAGALAPGVASACGGGLAVTLRLWFEQGYPLVEASIGGQAVGLLLDTGAQGMLITPAAARVLRLPVLGSTRIYGTGGSREAVVVAVRALRLGGALMPEQAAPVAELPVAFGGSPLFAGIAGASLLSGFGLELDVPKARAALWPPACVPGFRGATHPLRVTRLGEPFMAVRVNGQALTALLDTGSRATLLDQSIARRLGVSAPESANTARGVDGARLPLEHTRVRLGLGDEAARETPVSVTPLGAGHEEMLLGLDVLGRRRFWLDYARRQITFERR